MTQEFCTLVYTNCKACAEANDVDLEKILALKDIIQWNSDLDLDADADSDDICDGHIDYIEICCKKWGLV